MADTNRERAREHAEKAEELLAKQDRNPVRRGIDAGESNAHATLALYWTLIEQR
jgi:hypothetical protein